jgi:hypothetical protein
MSHLARVAAAGALGSGVALLLAACGQGSAPGTPAVRGVPLAPHVRIVERVRRCDGGAHPYCARQLVLASDPADYPSSGALLAAETRTLRRAGWSQAEGDTDYERGVESPGNRLRVTLATAADDLRSVEEGRIPRAPAIARALSAEMFARAPALSLMLQAGSA